MKAEITSSVPPTNDGIDRFAHVRDLVPTQRDGETWLPDDGILVSSYLDEASLEGYRLNPVVESIAGLGAVCLKSVRKTGGKHEGQHIRTHRLYTIEREGYRHAAEITDPVEGDAQFLIMSLPGFTEPIEGGIRKKMHARLSYEFPTARVVSIGSNGIGTTGDRYGANERSLHNIRAMGSQRLVLGRALGGDRPILGKGTSMGTKVLHHMAHENLTTAAADSRINLAGMFWLSPALVDPSNILKDMAVRFLPQLTGDAMKELAIKTPPLEVLHIIATARRYGLSRGDFRAIYTQMTDLLKGTKEEEIGEVLEEVPAIMVAGANDCLAQWPMMQRLSKQYDGHLGLFPIEGRGHSLAMKPGKACPKIARAGAVLVERTVNSRLLIPTASSL